VDEEAEGRGGGGVGRGDVNKGPGEGNVERHVEGSTKDGACH
jgi:hypothetical protein